MLTDEMIWNGFREGDMEMLLSLYRKYYHNLLFIGLKEEKDINLVKDAIQQQFLYLWEKRNSIQQASNIQAYLITSVLRKLRSGKTQVVQKSKLEVAWTNINFQTQATPEESIIAQETDQKKRQLMMKFIDSLSPRQKELIILKFYEGLSYNDIVAKTGLSSRTVYNKIHEALKKLKEIMGAEPALFGEALSLLLLILVACT